MISVVYYEGTERTINVGDKVIFTGANKIEYEMEVDCITEWPDGEATILLLTPWKCEQVGIEHIRPI